MTEIPLSCEQLAVIRTTMHAQRISQAQVGQWLGLGQARVSERLLGKKPFRRHQLVTLAERLGLGDLLALVAATADAAQRDQHRQTELLRCLAQTLRGLSPAQMDDLLLCLAVLLQGQGCAAQQASRVFRGLITRPAPPLVAVCPPSTGLATLECYGQEASAALAAPA